ncbi:MAG: DUF1349 domain-containing protein [Chloroflexi bacterium]|nr:DUF1349 domain-containing protein [Chloroflexota bacterium]
MRIPLNAKLDARRFYVGLLLLFVALILLACDLASITGSSTGGQPSPTLVAQETTVPGLPTLLSSAQATSVPTQPSGSVLSTAFGKIAPPNELNSYRARMLLELRKKDGGKPETMRVMQEWVKNPPAMHVATGEGTQAIEVITIGDKSWVKMGASWIESPSGQQRQSGIDAQQSYLPEQDVRVQALGDDTVNGVRCKRQAYSGKVFITIPAMPNRPETKTTFNVKGEICVAEQAGLPPVSVREKGELEGNLFGMLFQTVLGGTTKPDTGETTYFEHELYDINSTITIKPPDNVTQLPGLPTSPATKPTVAAQPTVARTPTAKPGAPTSTPQPTVATGTALFADEFASTTLNPKWVWQDRWEDAQYDLQARSGFIRITAPTGNDLWGSTNFDGPFLAQPINGNFIVETAVEFAPAEDFQGAGILIYQDDDNLVRVERAFGGTGGGEGGIHLSVIRDGVGETITGYDQASTSAKKVELRVQRIGNQITAWWREPGKTWQSLDSVSVQLNATVQVGIVTLAEWGVSDSVADFDYVRISRPR